MDDPSATTTNIMDDLGVTHGLLPVTSVAHGSLMGQYHIVMGDPRVTHEL